MQEFIFSDEVYSSSLPPTEHQQGTFKFTARVTFKFTARGTFKFTARGTFKFTARVTFKFTARVTLKFTPLASDIWWANPKWFHIFRWSVHEVKSSAQEQGTFKFTGRVYCQSHLQVYCQSHLQVYPPWQVTSSRQTQNDFIFSDEVFMQWHLVPKSRAPSSLLAGFTTRVTFKFTARQLSSSGQEQYYFQMQLYSSSLPPTEHQQGTFNFQMPVYSFKFTARVTLNITARGTFKFTARVTFKFTARVTLKFTPLASDIWWANPKWFHIFRWSVHEVKSSAQEQGTFKFTGRVYCQSHLQVYCQSHLQVYPPASDI